MDSLQTLESALLIDGHGPDWAVDVLTVCHAANCSRVCLQGEMAAWLVVTTLILEYILVRAKQPQPWVWVVHKQEFRAGSTVGTTCVPGRTFCCSIDLSMSNCCSCYMVQVLWSSTTDCTI